MEDADLLEDPSDEEIQQEIKQTMAGIIAKNLYADSEEEADERYG